MNLSLLYKIVDNHLSTSESIDQNNSNRNFGCLIVDASHSKVMPDAFSRTIPIWASVLNRVINKLREQKELRIKTNNNDSNSINTSSYIEKKESEPMNWDTNLYTPLTCVTIEEHNEIESILDKHVDSVLSSGVILDPDWLIKNVTKPLKPYWITNNGSIPSICPRYSKDYISIVCVSCSNMNNKLTKMTSPILHQFSTHAIPKVNERHQIKQYSWYYTPGAGDDHESWSHGLTPSLFWSHRSSILQLATSRHNYSHNPISTKSSLDEIDETNLAIHQILKTAKLDIDKDHNLHTTDDRQRIMLEIFEKNIYCSIYSQPSITNDSKYRSKKNNQTKFDDFVPKEKMNISEYYSIIGGTNIAIGSRRAGRPPQCWEHFDAIINVSMNEYSDLFLNVDFENYPDRDDNQNDSTRINSRYYMQMPVLEGKRDRTELEKWMTVAMAFIVGHTNKNRRILIHCAQGKDRSVAVAMAAIALLYKDEILHEHSSIEMQQELNGSSTKCNVTSGDRDKDKRKLSHSSLPSRSLKHGFNALTFQEMESRATISCTSAENPLNDKVLMNNFKSGKEKPISLYRRSGMSNFLVQQMMGREGRDMFFAWITDLHQVNSVDNIDKRISSTFSMPTKESLRRVLHFIQIFRQNASPTRNTIQKLNRFLMSSSHEKNINGKSSA